MTTQDTAPACPSCASQAAKAQAATGSPQVALVGAPNSGKSTLFNALTGARRSVGNWPGTTVEVGEGGWFLQACDGRREVALLDLPGAYSLDPASPDEELTRRLLVDVPAADRPDAVVAVVDAAHLARSLHLVAQLREHSLRLVVALTMTDLAARRAVEIDDRALEEALGLPVVVVDPRRRTGTSALDAAVDRVLDRPVPAPRPMAAGPEADDLELADERFAWALDVVERATRSSGGGRRTWTDRIDRWATAPVAGPLLFLAAMFVVFQTTTTVAAPFQDALDTFFSGPVTNVASALLQAVGLGETPLHGLVVNGLVAGVGMLLTFLPVMSLMFILLSVLEDSGYMARAAVVTDRMMRLIGLPGRAFLPLVVGFGCNVPAISATRALPNARHRILTTLLIPFTSCSARLTVYVLLATTFMPAQAGLVVFGMYLVSILLVVLVGLLLRRTLWRTMGGEPLMIDLPPYQRPTLGVVGLVSWIRVKGFLRTAGGIIVAAVTVVWLLQSVPVRGDAGFAEVPPGDSLYAATAQAVSPAFEPAGFGQWQTTGALMVGFVAKEAVVSSWAQTYATQEPQSSSQPGALAGELRQAFESSSGGHPIPAVLAFLVFILAYTPCVATLAAQKREVGLRWTAVGIGVQLAVAWLLAVAVFQLGRLIS
ncbi:ferrous iron transport protein B [Intrasporangium calvum]|uniref:Ferrous iron transport protein B n=1 Tax=Intrasporangium calvum TaxID=53358 RepID=A0ABT5GHJ4_9MICO|nr:ferrous iron transport protein B [Intrasporangium calvum]MDC5697672.1 ferrous iron transport protein B [Intrasporangium calvum]